MICLGKQRIYVVTFTFRKNFVLLTDRNGETMRRSNLIVLFSILLLLIGSCNNPEVRVSSADKTDELNYDWFVDPPVSFRSHPFYSINDSLTEDEISRQIKDFKTAGFGGFYLHSRSGLITEFLGDDWWKVMQAAVDAANEAGLRCMFYDEDKWPSGYAGGIIPRMSEDYRAKCLARLDKNTPLPTGAEIIGEDSTTYYVIYTAQFGYEIFNGTCYVDLFNPEAVQAFIDVSYRPYVEKYRAQITNYRPAIFSDEPHVHARYFDRNTPNLGTLSYSPWLEKKFKEMYGYELRDKLELLYEEKENWREVRMQYYRAKALAFEESYTGQLASFCGEHNMDYTGHYLAEDVLEKVRDRAANTMLHYRTMQQPGIDFLGMSIENRLITGRNMSSVANQYSKAKRLSELFGISGQNMNFEDRKWIAGWHSILGINHFCPHLTLYSMKGHRKRDYPPTFSYQQPYWKYNNKLEDYLGRIAYAASVGTYQPQLLVISPLESEYIKGNDDGEFTSGMLKVLDALQTKHYDYDVGDEQILADTAYVKGNNLIIGDMHYAHVILPDMISIRQTTIDLIEELQNAGGLVFNTGRFPKFVDGKEAPEKLERLKDEVIDLGDNIGDGLSDRLEPQVKIRGNGAEKIWIQTRIVDGGTLVQLANTSHTESIRFKLSSDLLVKNLVLWDPSAVKCYSLENDGQGEVELELAASTNCWITSGKLSSDVHNTGVYQLPAATYTERILDGPWKGQRLSPNSLTLDFASYSTATQKAGSPEPVIGIFSRLADQNFSGELLLNFPFNIETVPSECSLVLEQPGMYSEISINGTNYQFSDDGYFVDRTFRTSDISDLLKAGENHIQLKLDFKAPQPLSDDPKTRYGTEIESVYLIGNFGVKGINQSETFDTQRNRTGDFQKRPVFRFDAFKIIAEQDQFSGELAENGYPFFAGEFLLSQNIEMDKIDPAKHYFLELPNNEAVATVVKINKQVVDTLVWSPFRTEITDYLVEGENLLELTLVNSLRNLLGPHHHKGGELTRVGPDSFTGAGGFPDGRGISDWYDIRTTSGDNPIWTDTYNIIPFGLLEQAKITSN